MWNVVEDVDGALRLVGSSEEGSARAGTIGGLAAEGANA